MTRPHNDQPAGKPVGEQTVRAFGPALSAWNETGEVSDALGYEDLVRQSQPSGARFDPEAPTPAVLALETGDILPASLDTSNMELLDEPLEPPTITRTGPEADEPPEPPTITKTGPGGPRASSPPPIPEERPLAPTVSDSCRSVEIIATNERALSLPTRPPTLPATPQARQAATASLPAMPRARQATTASPPKPRRRPSLATGQNVAVDTAKLDAISRLSRLRWLLLGAVPVAIGLGAGFGLSALLERHRQRQRLAQGAASSVRSQRFAAAHRVLATRAPRSSPLPRAAPLRGVSAGARLRLARAHALTDRGQHLGAHLLYATVLAHDPLDLDAVDGFARTATATSEPGPAAAGAGKPGPPALGQLRRLLQLRRLMLAGHWPAAVKTFAALPPALRQLPRLRLWQAEIAIGLGALEQARGVYEQLLAAGNQDHQLRIEALVGLSEVLLARRYRTAALVYARRALRELDAGHPQALRQRVTAQLEACLAARKR